MPPARRASLTAAALAFASALLASRGARAQFIDGGVTTGTTAFAPSDFFVGVQGTLGANLSDFDAARFFNKARCDCSQTVYVYVALLQSGVANIASVQAAAPNGSIEFWVGSNCSDPNFRQQYCQPLGGGSELLATFLQQGPKTIPTNARILSTYTAAGVTALDGGTTTNMVFPPGGNPDCTLPTSGQFNQQLWVLVSNSGTLGQYDTIVTTNVLIDLSPPPEPDPNSISVTGGDQALIVGWQKLDTTLYPDLFGYQILCNRGGSLQVFDTGAFGPGFTSADSLVASGQATVDMCAGTALGTGILSLDPAYVCSPLLTSSASSYRVKILQNEIVYGVSVVSVDNSGNASQPPDIFYGTPIKTKSFYDVYRDGFTGSGPNYPPGAATGGFCAVGSPGTRRGSALAAVAIGLGGFAIVVARRRRRR